MTKGLEDCGRASRGVRGSAESQGHDTDRQIVVSGSAHCTVQRPSVRQIVISGSAVMTP